MEEGRRGDITSVVYTISIEGNLFRVQGIDKSDGIGLRISAITWDGETLRFESLFPPTRHKASHEFTLVEEGRARHTTRYADEDGTIVVEELWKKVS
jgi:hypothetical protein